MRSGPRLARVELSAVGPDHSSYVSTGIGGRSSRKCEAKFATIRPLSVRRWILDVALLWPVSVRRAARELFRGSQRRSQIAQLVVDLVGSLDGLGDFIAKQRAIASPQLVHEAFYRYLRHAERF